ncbi:beta-ketoacyl-ACP reductase [Paenibacillus baekrokdamisoli]|uniref:Beta-ketoacyl-ACP reductase n=1 Tax=Paenibacillus baekrokdamisoli TaxID=1712516 RepID=A0A3G9IUV2_9BACL|nr:SDR family NAD(P)-dependent oxidoreductase [Paenibacillus baekrokdamisoli]MBB3068368.1 3-oxoacyl-[acyl-carrier protein] reductase [Paenibacillus baekrokdamisoli]BBH22587.1 beta-ketoacyl-ACP reductase [Paenibacillus baekrokdamisoli]
MIIDVRNKTIVVTGSSRGIGRELIRKFATEGANIVINYYQNQASAEELLFEVNSITPKCIAIRADVRDIKQVGLLCEKTIQSFGKIDVLINNAGICSDNLISFMTDQQWNDIVATNLSSVFYCSKVFSKEMIKKKAGKIINITSLKGQHGSEGQTNYCASKAGVIGFTKALAKELGKFNISVNALCPGFIPTDLNRHDEFKRQVAIDKSVLNLDPSLDDLVNFILYMSSDMFNGISGQVFNLDSRIL